MSAPPTDARRLLLLGFEPADRARLERALRPFQYEMTAAGSELEAVRILDRERVNAVLIEVASPGLDGPRSVRRLCVSGSAPAVVALSAANDAALAAACFKEGASDYLVEGTDAHSMDAALRAAVERRQAMIRRAEAHEALRDELGRVTIQLRRARRSGARVSMGTLGSLVSMMEIRDRYLAGHSVRVAQLAASMAAELGHSARDVEQLRAAGRLHDIGMLCVAEGILSKAGPLTPAEFERVRQHVEIADQILREVPQLDPIRQFVRSHHERWDGAGYPDRLAGEAIPWGARLIGVAEVYDAMTTSRPYQAATPPEETLDRIGRLSGTAIAPEAYEALVRIVENGRALVFIDGDGDGRVASLEATDGADPW